MEALTAFIKLIGKLFIPISAYFAGKKAKDNENLKAENEKLKKYKDIDDGEHSSNDAYNAGLWK